MSLTQFSIHSRLRRLTWAVGLVTLVYPFAYAQAADFAQSDAAAEPPQAASFDKGRFSGVRQKLSDWEVIVGVGAIYGPKFEGSDEMEVMPVPLISGKIGRVNLEPLGISVDLIDTNGFKLAAKGGYEFGRDEDDSRHLRGLGDIDGSAVLGAKLSYETGPLELYASIDKSIGGSDGLLGTVGANVSHHYDRFIFGAGASATFADDNHMKSYFGVTAAQSARSGLRQYDAGAGLKRVDLEASVTYMASEHWLIRAQGGVGFLTGDAKDSPIVQNDVQPSAMLIVGYKF